MFGPRIAERKGLKAHQTVGCLKDFKKGFVPDNFSGNKAFKDIIHSIAAMEIPDAIRAKAKAIGTGRIRLIDERIASEAEEADDEHCIGFYKVENGLVAGYEPNMGFRLFSEKGHLELVESIRKVLYSEIAS